MTTAILRLGSLALALFVASAIACGNGATIVELNPVGAGGAGGGSAGATSACSSNEQCMAPSPYCLGGACVQCQTDENCSGVSDRPLCNMSTHTCVECVDLTRCAATETCDAVTGRCRELCASDADCEARCAIDRGVCVECLSEQDCGAEQPYCDVLAGACVECLADGNCPTGQTCSAGRECTDG